MKEHIHTQGRSHLKGPEAQAPYFLGHTVVRVYLGPTTFLGMKGPKWLQEIGPPHSQKRHFAHEHILPFNSAAKIAIPPTSII